LKSLILLAAMIISTDIQLLAGNAAIVFTHPGMTNSKAELDFVKAKIKAGAEPWYTAFQKMKSSNFGNMYWVPKAMALVNTNNSDANIENDDATAAYTQALLWYFTDNEAYAKKSVEILNAWSSKLIAHTSTDLQKQLVAAWCGSVFVPAAEIMRFSYPKWTTAESTQFSTMLNNAFLPLLVSGNPTYNGNWELSMINALVCIGVFNEDTTTFNLGVFLWRKRVPAYFYMTTDGVSPFRPYGTISLNSETAIKNYWVNPYKYFDGLCQETYRDYGHHMQMGLASAVNTAEIAYHQGIDLYSENDKRITTAMEFQASALMGYPVSTDLFPNGFVVSDLLPTWEIAYNHFHNRKGYDLPMTNMLISSKVRPSYFTTMLNMAWESGTHAGLDNTTTHVASGDASTGGIPQHFGLSQNYPNPFNPSTTISYSLQRSSFVTLRVYDVTGRTVATVVSEQKEAGMHTVRFDASALSTGIYVYRLSTENSVISKRMILLK
jgi:Alginate lyase/Secretion system C-terminal sorting domain